MIKTILFLSFFQSVPKADSIPIMIYQHGHVYVRRDIAEKEVRGYKKLAEDVIKEYKALIKQLKTKQ